jgi:glycosyltransferase involved in cell wall biosynthesis
MKGDLDIGFIFRLKKILRQENADIVHLHSRRGADVLGGIAAKLARVKCVLSRRVDNPESPLIVKFKYRLYDRVVSISEGIRQVLISEGESEEKIICVHSSVDVEKYSQAADRRWFLSEFGLPENAQVLAVIAQLIQRKGHRYLLEVLPDLLQRYPDLYVLFFGQGPLQAELAQQITRPELQGRVRLAGFRNDLQRVLPCLYGVVHPADMEGLGVSLLQAAASGIPVIGSAVGGIPEIIHDRVNGYLIPAGNTQQLMQSLNELLADPDRARKMGEAGRQIVQEKFSIAAMVQGNLRVYESLVDFVG